MQQKEAHVLKLKNSIILSWKLTPAETIKKRLNAEFHLKSAEFLKPFWYSADIDTSETSCVLAYKIQYSQKYKY